MSIKSKDHKQKCCCKDHRIEIYEINKISFSCFDDKLYFQNNGCNKLSLAYQS